MHSRQFIFTFKKLFLTLILGLMGILGSAQSLENIQDIEVDELSDAQIVQMIERAENAGMNEQQLEALARERGMPASEVAKLRQRVGQLRAQVGGPKQAQNQRGITGESTQPRIFDSIRKADPYIHLTPTQKKIFGYKLFHNQELSFTPSMNIPTPSSYVIGAGDELFIDVYGASEQNYVLNVTPEGSIFISNVGPIQVAGLTIEAATQRLKSELSNIYSGIRGSNPDTFLSLRLGNIRSIQVNMVGELRKPGTYTLSSFATVFNALFAAGGPNENGSFRHIQVYRNSELMGEVDVYDFLTTGNQRSNIMLKEGDVVLVPPVRVRVEIQGAVKRPGLFEMAPSENITNLLQFAGGFSAKAYKNSISVRRPTETAYKIDDIGQDFFDDFSARDGDFYTVGEILNRFENRVQVSGAVTRPGEFSLTQGLTLRELIEKAGGLEGDAFSSRATLYRTGENLIQEALSINLQALMDGDIPDIELRREDVLHVASTYDIREEYYLSISGEVNDIGIYPYVENMTVEDLILRADGLKESASNSLIEIARRVKGGQVGDISEILQLTIDPELNLDPESAGITLQPFDHVFVRKAIGFERERMVSVEGEVNYPGDFVLGKADERISDVLKRAGGLNNYAYPKGATLIRRTENYTKIKEEERRLEILQSLLENTRVTDSIGRAQTEKDMIERLEQRIKGLEQELERDRQKEMKKRLYSEGLLPDDSVRVQEEAQLGMVPEETRETELVGIELKKILENPHSKYDLILEEGDVLQIPKELQTVRMRGEVLYPATARYDDNRSFKNYISRAGGFTPDSKRSRAYVIYANGDAKQTKNFLGIKFYPKIEPGAEIVVPAKPDRTPISPQAWVSIGTGLATMALLFVQLFNGN